MKLTNAILGGVATITIAVTGAVASGPKLDGAYRYVSTVFPGGQQTDAEAKGLIVVHGKHMAFVRASVDRKSWDQNEPEDERAKKMVAAYQGLAATCGTFEVQGNIITLQQVAQASPASMGKPVKWEYKLEGETLKLKPVATQGVEFTFERVE